MDRHIIFKQKSIPILIALLLSLFLSGCDIEREYNPRLDIGFIEPVGSLLRTPPTGDRDDSRRAYTKCLMNVWIIENLGADLEGNIRQPRETVTQFCQPEGQIYYRALFNSNLVRNRNEDYRRKTARYTIINVNHVTFTYLERLFPTKGPYQ